MSSTKQVEQEDTTYNGWTNYETWVTKLWMDSDESSQRYWADVVASTFESVDPDHPNPHVACITRSDQARYNLADLLKEWHEEQTPTISGVFADLLNAALSEVNWREIAGSLLESIVGYES